MRNYASTRQLYPFEPPEGSTFTNIRSILDLPFWWKKLAEEHFRAGSQHKMAIKKTQVRKRQAHRLL
ncbi:hypothetical protein ANANG_G00245790 [Anguilla anguilla]|uniref:Uncharacterized protein n=1 Tax=Anguilla anguilla TaxID=7936 RepID=A0A9D3LVJ4_ANGAN|nr:hypothetical protein ANANG_G00245790 [Anguilla anguilla]